jgi:hypothetical protein
MMPLWMKRLKRRGKQREVSVQKVQRIKKITATNQMKKKKIE